MTLLTAEHQGDEPLHIMGRVARPPEVRFQIDPITMRSVPVLQLELQVDDCSPHVLVRQPFPFQQVDGCHAAARRYKLGSLVSVDAAWQCVQVIFQNVSHIQLIEKT